MTLYDKVGWVIPVESYLESLEQAKLPPLRRDSIPDKKGDATSAASNVAICYFLQGKTKEAGEFGREAVSAVLDYFYGDWRKEVETEDGDIDPAWWGAHLLWIDPFREALCWASALGDWPAVEKLAQYPSDSSSRDHTTEDRAAYLALASLLRGEPAKKQAPYLAEIGRRKKAKPNLLAEVFCALQANSSARFQTTLAGYLDHFRKSEFNRKRLDRLLCLDGTTLLNLGVRRGLQVAIPAPVEAHIVRFGP
jgi:hypothetical protein